MKIIGFMVIIAVAGWFAYSQAQPDAKKDLSLENESSRTIALNESFEAVMYDITPLTFECDAFELTDKTTKQGCVLTASITNTSISEFKLNVDGNVAVTAGETEYKSSQDISRQLAGVDVLADDLEKGESQEYKIFFDVPASAEIATVEISEGERAEPIVITL